MVPVIVTVKYRLEQLYINYEADQKHVVMVQWWHQMSVLCHIGYCSIMLNIYHIYEKHDIAQKFYHGSIKLGMASLGLYFVSVYSIGYLLQDNVSGYVCNHGSPSGERDTASPRGRYGERPQRDSVWRYIWKNTTCWPATAHDVTTGVPQYKCRREDTSSASSSEACVRSMAQSPGDAVSRSPLGEPWLHT